MGAPELNTTICTLQDIVPVIQAQNEFNTTVFDAITNGSTTDTYKVAVDIANVGTPNYLNDQLYFGPPIATNFGNPNAVVPVFNDVLDAKQRLLADFTQVLGFPDTGDPGDRQFLELVFHATVDGGCELRWASVDGVFDSNHVLVTGDDSTPSTFHDAIDLNATYIAGADILVGSETVGIAGTDQTERLFVDVSAVSGYNAVGTFFLGLVNNVTTYINAADIVSAGASAGYAIDVSGSTVGFDPTEITGFTAAFQLFGHLSSASAATDPAWITFSGYDATKKQIPWHQSGSFSFNTAGNYDSGAHQHLGHINGAWQFLGEPRFAITTEAIPAATGNYNGNISPGKTAGSSNIRLYDFGTNYGDPATQSTLGKCENYMKTDVGIHKPIFVFERAPGIFVLPTEGCVAYTAS